MTIAAQSSTTSRVPAESVREEMTRILESPDYAVSARRRQLLEFLVNEALAGNGHQLKGYTIGVAVFNRSEDFDPQADPIVRIEAHRLRRDLDSYYAGIGRDDPIRIKIPKGRYVPQFEWHDRSNAEHGGAQDTAATEEVAGARQARPYRRYIAAVTAAALVLVALWLIYPPGTPNATDSEVHEDALGPILAIMPLNNIGSPVTQANFSVGMAEQMATEFLRFGSLRVVATGALKPENIQFVDPQQLRDELHVDYVLDGHFRVADHNLRLSMRLIDTSSSEYVWKKEYTRQLTPENIYNLQDDIVSEVTANIAGKYGVLARSSMVRSGRRPPRGLNAYECVLQYYAYQNSIEPQRNREIIACLENTVRDEPDFAEAWAILGNLYMQDKRFGFSDQTRDVVEKARFAINRSIELNPETSTSHLMMANLLFTEGDIAGFRQHGERALELNPNDPDLLAHYGMRLTFLGDTKRGIQLVNRAIALNPSYPSWYRFARIVFHFERGEYEEALEQTKGIDMPSFFWKPLWMAVLSARLGDRKTADLELRKLREMQPDFDKNGIELMRYWHFSNDMQQSVIKTLSDLGLHLQTS